MLGHGTAGSYASHDSKYGQLSNMTATGYFECTGTEKDLHLCQNRNRTSRCPTRIAGVICGLVGRTSKVPLVLSGGSNRKEGNVILYGQPIW